MICANHNVFCAVNYWLPKAENIEITFRTINTFGTPLGHHLWICNIKSEPQSKTI